MQRNGLIIIVFLISTCSYPYYMDLTVWTEIRHCQFIAELLVLKEMEQHHQYNYFCDFILSNTSTQSYWLYSFLPANWMKHFSCLPIWRQTTVYTDWSISTNSNVQRLSWQLDSC
jgi:hypothetical protein